MGDALIARLTRAGIVFRTLEVAPERSPGPVRQR